MFAGLRVGGEIGSQVKARVLGRDVAGDDGNGGGERDLLDVVMADAVTMEEVDASQERLEPSASLGFVNFDGDEAGEVVPGKRRNCIPRHATPDRRVKISGQQRVEERTTHMVISANDGVIVNEWNETIEGCESCLKDR